jgi:hypothetical protein
MAPRKAEAVSLAKLTKSVESAIRIAAARHELNVEKDTLLDRWEIVGRRLRNVQDFNVAFRFAEDVTRGVKLPGIRVEPVVTRIGKDILVGFVERSRAKFLLR